MTFEQFFRDYAEAVAGLDLPRRAAFYCDTFIAAGPHGSESFGNDEKFLDWLKDRQAFRQQSGMTGMNVMSIGEPLTLSEKHVLTKVEWGSTFHQSGGRTIRSQISYVLEKQRQGWKILMTVAEKDEAEEMQEQGILRE